MGEILKGNFKESMKDFKRLMTDYAQEMKYGGGRKNKRKDRMKIINHVQQLLIRR